jgi:TonB-dependent starch-binding outer membrane protein SusC
MKRKIFKKLPFKLMAFFLSLLFFSSSLLAQSNAVSGTIKDENGKPLPGVTVLNKNSGKGTATMSDGTYTVEANKGDVITFSYVGLQTVEITVGKQQSLNVSLNASVRTNDEVVVVGYGTQKKENLTGSVASVGAKYLENRPLTSASVALQGTVPGVFINQNSGQPGRNEVNIRIRGVGTLNNAAPLVLVDGIEAPLDNINPDDIASLTVLKDAASAAIYGSRAANGVVLVTTKRGKNKKGKVNLSYNGYAGTTEATRLPKMVTNSFQFATLRNEANTNFGNPVVFNDNALNYFKTKGPNTSWYDVIFNPGHLQNHTISLDGGNEQTNYRLSFGYQEEKGVTLKSGAKRYNGRFNLDTKPLDNLTFSTSLSLVRGNRFSSQDDLSTGKGSPVYRAAESVPLLPAYDSLGRLAHANSDITGPNLGNPLEQLYGGEFRELSLDILGSAGVDYNPIPGLNLSGTIAINYRNYNQSTFNPSFSSYDFITGQEYKYNSLRGASRSFSEGRNTTVVLKASYEKNIGNHYFKLLGGFNQEDADKNIFSASRNGFLSNTIRVLGVGDPSSATNDERGTTWGLRSYFGRLNYSWQQKYLFEANVRADGTSRFQTKKWGTFPSVSAGWVLSKENFFKPLLKTFNQVKLRGSWGSLGNQIADPNDDFIYVKQLSLTQNYNFGGTVVPGVAQTTLGNDALTWETTTATDFGVDMALWNSKLTVTADYFVRNTSDILFAVPISPLTGFSTQIQNSAKVQNKGWELAASYQDKLGDLNFSIGANVTHVTSTIKQINKNLANGGVDRFIYGNEGRRVAESGSPLNSLYGVEAIGLFQTQDEITKSPDQSGLNPNFGPGDLKFFDTNGDGKITNADRKAIGKEDPTWIYGANLNIGYKGFDLGALFNGAADFSSYSGEEISRPFFSNASLEQTWLNRWTPTNTNTTVPRLFFTDGPSTSINSSYWVLNRSYFRLKNLSLGYTFPTSWLGKAKITRLRIYLNASNLFTITKFPYFDPERPAGRDRGQEGYPNIRVISAGINLNF